MIWPAYFSLTKEMVLAVIAAAVLTACGGGSTAEPIAPTAVAAPAAPTAPVAPITPAAPAIPVATTTPAVGPAGSSTFIITNATRTSRNGTYAVSSASGGTTAGAIDYNGNTLDSNFEWDVQYTAAGAIKAVVVWYYDKFANGAQNIVYFGCTGTACTGVSYDAVKKQVLFSNSVLPYNSTNSQNGAVAGPAEGPLTVNGFVNVQ